MTLLQLVSTGSALTPNDVTRNSAKRNFLADRFASDTPSPRSANRRLHPLTVTASQALQNLLLDEDWVVVSPNGLPYLGSTLHAVQLARWDRYINTRDENRLVAGREIKWATLSIQTASTLHGNASLPYTKCARVSKLVYDWYFHGARMVLGSSDLHPTPLPCKICNAPDSQYHMLCGCKHPPIDHARSSIIRNISTVLQSLDPVSAKYKVLEAIRYLADPSTTEFPPHYLWIGTWSPGQVAYLKNALREVPFVNNSYATDETICFLRATCKSLTTGAFAIMDARHNAHTQLDKAVRRLYRREHRPRHRSTLVNLSSNVAAVHAASRTLNKFPSSTLSTALHHVTSLLTTNPSRRTRQTPQPALSPFLHPDIDNASAPPLNIGRITPVHQPRSSAPPSETTPPLTRGYHPRSRARRPSSHISSTPSTLSPDTLLPPPPVSPPTSIHGTRHVPTALEHEVYSSLRSRTDSAAVVTPACDGYSWPSTVEDYHRLMGLHDNGWLNSTNITNVSELFNGYSPPPDVASSFHCLSAYFFPKISTHTRAFTYADVDNWFTADPRRNPLLCDFLYIPINLTGSHISNC